MEIIRSVNTIQKKINTIIGRNEQIGFVATMGFFHAGHISLMKQAIKENDIVVTSIFVNPLQFGPGEDYDQYPRDEDRDIQLAEQSGVDILFVPDVKDMYPKTMHINMSINERVNVLCGRSRPGHFDGVITVLSKLFNILRPDRTYFGMKDAQQVAVVDALISDLNFPIEIVGLPTTRENDGLAKSSRNVNLNKNERIQAVWLYKALKKGQEFVIDGEKNPDIIVKKVMDIITKQTTGTIDYVELLSYPDLKPVSVIDQQVVLATAVYFEHARLIDNLLFDEKGNLINVFKQGEI
ncbi:pantoate--beta-alanine ligase [Virgibacillus profundi]|uniref:Pantothenate synthetase n=1 Tax=Virgibacillus profundi TaxID=2024555 RepID=A0A2A2IDY6_9BACI|nr:pantoate--beta-alanine ligase [Virgibacillus profundi]PAV29474.1 pantoate--beta-alanine ligase [Virgibacillus profundi]PXY53643.1 pantoate--beta-alanine ligase [Virgibacillus profundi]